MDEVPRGYGELLLVFGSAEEKRLLLFLTVS